MNSGTIIPWIGGNCKAGRLNILNVEVNDVPRPARAMLPPPTGYLPIRKGISQCDIPFVYVRNQPLIEFEMLARMPLMLSFLAAMLDM